ncbi:MAG: dTMP kinase [Geodermatophilaceae bacterium]|nr:dTMP kinase [Geodermatophilaceae bacterium]MDQ3454148.1 dTMP kinase [Actinomycetota bacterium]
MTGLFVAFEGGEGAGKTVQLGLLAEWLQAAGHRVRLTREPGATPAGERIRGIVLDPGSTLTPRAEALLYAADRAEHVETVIVPALAAGEVVLSDRYVDSTLAYQGAGRALDSAQVRQLNDWATGGLCPDLTVLLDLDPTIGLARAGGRRRLDRIEQESLAFHHRVRAEFLRLAATQPARYLVLDAGGELDALAVAVRHRLAGLLATVVTT